MPVIGDREFNFRVNVTRTNGGFAQENYGLFYDLSALPTAGRHAGRRMQSPNFAE
jgi:hypothetical protein